MLKLTLYLTLNVTVPFNSNITNQVNLKVENTADGNIGYPPTISPKVKPLERVYLYFLSLVVW